VSSADCVFPANVWQNGRLETPESPGALSRPVRPESIERPAAGVPTWQRPLTPVISLENTTPVAVKIKLKRLGKIRNPQYRIVVADARTKRDGRAIEEIGLYHPKEEPSRIEVNSERAQYWLGVGAQPTEPVLNLLKITGDWQKFKGEPGAEGTLRVAEPKGDKKAAFEAAVKESMGDTDTPATASRAKKKAEPKKAKGDAEGAKADETTEAKSEG
jgi:ribosomal protein S16